MAQARRRQTVQDIIQAQRQQRERMAGQMANNAAKGAENPNLNYALSQFGSGFGSALTAGLFGETPEVLEARQNDAATEAAINNERRQNYILKNSFDSLGMFSQEGANEAGRIFDEVVNPQQKGSPTTTPGAFNGEGDGGVIVSPLDYDEQGSVPISHVAPEDDTQAQFANANASKGALKERNDWLRSTSQSDPFRQTTIAGTPRERDDKLWQLYRESQEGERAKGGGSGGLTTPSGIPYTVRDK